MARKRSVVELDDEQIFAWSAARRRLLGKDHGARHVEQIRRAGQQIDREPGGGRLAWILRFIREDSTRWSVVKRDAHGFRLIAVAHRDELPPNLVASDRYPPMEAEEVDTLHAELRDALAALVRGEVVLFPTDGIVDGIVQVTAPGKKPAQYGLINGGPYRTRIFQALKRLILEADGRVLACPRCWAPFLALRKRKFCSDDCRQHWHDARRPRRREEK